VFKALIEEKPQIWQTRWAVMKGLIDHTAKNLPAGLPHGDTFALLLNNLKAFGEGQFNYFYTKLINGEEAPEGFSQHYALSQTLDQIGRDMTVIAQCIHQREEASPNEVRSTLELADRFATAILKPAQPYLGETNAEAITYLNKSELTRVVPYASVALIGVPFSAVNLDDNLPRLTRDYMAIPHEVGHYVYWHGRTRGKGAYDGVRFCWVLPHQAKQANVAEWARDWAEEAFADTYGGRTAGPMLAVTFQDLLIQRDSDEDFTGNNGEHPTSFIRPEGHVITLEALRQKDWAELLRDVWAQKRRRVVPDNAPLKINHGQIVSHTDASAALKALTTSANTLLSTVNFDANRAKALFSDIGTAGSDDVIYKMWVAEVDGISPTRDLPPARAKSPSFVWVDWKAQLLADVAKVASLEKAEAPEWKVILGAGGWIDGPGSVPPVK